MSQPDSVVALVKLNGGRIVGRTRLQKTVYLLESCGVDLGFDFDYHHYGPYSEDLSIASSDAVALGLIEMQWHNAYGNEYAVFTTVAEPETKLSRKAGDALKILDQYDAVTLELAATVDFLERNGYPETAWEEMSRRKASKITTHRVSSSRKLLKELALLK
jgi:uncharacterized protein